MLREKRTRFEQKMCSYAAMPTRSSDARKIGIPLAAARYLLDNGERPSARRWAEQFDAHIHLRIGNRPVVSGAAKATIEIARLFDRILAIGTAFRYLWAAPDGETVLMELDLTPIEAIQPIPAAIMLRALNPAPVIRDLRFYLDPAPLFLAPADPPADGLRRMN